MKNEVVKYEIKLDELVEINAFKTSGILDGTFSVAEVLKKSGPRRLQSFVLKYGTDDDKMEKSLLDYDKEISSAYVSNGSIKALFLVDRKDDGKVVPSVLLTENDVSEKVVLSLFSFSTDLLVRQGDKKISIEVVCKSESTLKLMKYLFPKKKSTAVK